MSMAGTLSLTDSELASILSQMTTADGSAMPRFPKSTIKNSIQQPRMSLNELFPKSEVLPNMEIANVKEEVPTPEPSTNPRERLYFDDPLENDTSSTFRSEWHEMVTAPLFTSSVLEAANSSNGVGRFPKVFVR
jgi:hypothetical protein